MQVSQYYRSYELPWELDPDDRKRLQRIVTVGLTLLLLFGAILPFIHLPPLVQAPTPVPDRLARLMVQEKPKPPPPVPEVKAKPEVKPVPVPAPKPVDKVAEAKKRAQREFSKIEDELADLRQEQVDLGQAKNLQGAVGQDSHAERSMIASKAGVGSGGIVTTAIASAGFGRGAGALGDYQANSVSSKIAQASHSEALARGASGKASRSEEEIALIFDRNKGAIYALYGRALRAQPDLAGKLVLEFTISPTGEVTECHVVSSELHDPELERMIVARVKLFRFEARDVATITTTKPIEFVPAT